MNATMRGIMKKGDVGILLLAFLLAGGFYLYASRRTVGESVYVTIKGETTIYRLDRNTVISLKNETGAYNTIVIDNHTVFMEDASCPDQICVYHTAISKNGETIICLPNQVFIEIENDEQREIDN